MAGSKRELSALSSDLGGYWAPSGAAEGGKQEKVPSTANTVAKTTQFYAGDRVEIDASFLEKFTDIPRIHGTPGTLDFRVRFDSSEGGASLEQLQAARRSWDEHLSKIPEASKRLHACIELFGARDMMPLPLFFTGKGALADVIIFHLSVDSTAIVSGPTLSRPLGYRPQQRVFLPQTVIGDYVDTFLFHAFCGHEEFPPCRYAATEDAKRMVHRLVKGAPFRFVAPFFEPMDVSFMASLTFFSGGGSTFAWTVKDGLKHTPGNNAVQSMKAFSRYLEEEGHGPMDELDWLISLLESKKTN